ncbi:hypothetical protein V2P20_02800 [Methylobacter sp. Wu1]|uniref:hypothetical protein n=1 Tax=Methylobacter sp. Wu1 TaxID=3119359 RepID=UPI002F92E1D7
MTQMLPTFIPVAPGMKAVIVEHFTMEFGLTIYGIAVQNDDLLCATTQGVLRIDGMLDSTGSTEEDCAFGILNTDGSIDSTGPAFKDVYEVLNYLDKVKRRAQRIAEARAKQAGN